MKRFAQKTLFSKTAIAITRIVHQIKILLLETRFGSTAVRPITEVLPKDRGPHGQSIEINRRPHAPTTDGSFSQVFRVLWDMSDTFLNKKAVFRQRNADFKAIRKHIESRTCFGGVEDERACSVIVARRDRRSACVRASVGTNPFVVVRLLDRFTSDHRTPSGTRPYDAARTSSPKYHTPSHLGTALISTASDITTFQRASRVIPVGIAVLVPRLDQRKHTFLGLSRFQRVRQHGCDTSLYDEP